MAITIKGIRVEHATFTRDDAEGGYRVSTTYSLMSSVDKVLAKQEVGGYNGMKIEPSSQTQKLLDAFMVSYKADIETVLGLEAV